MDEAPEIVQIEPEMETIVDFVSDNKIRMYVLLAHQNPTIRRDQQQGMVHWSCKIIKDQQHIIVYFSKGVTIRRWCQPPLTIEDTIPLHVPHDKIGESYDGPLPPFDHKQDKQIFNRCSEAEPPFIIEILDVLAKDGWLIEQTGTFERWAEARKTSPDSIRAARSFEAVKQQQADLQALLGKGEYYTLLYEIDRL